MVFVLDKFHQLHYSSK